MTTAMQIFTNEDFGNIRIVIYDGEPWFVAADVCRALDIENTTQALMRLNDDEKMKISENRVMTNPILNIGSEKREINIVNEPGLYRLIFASRKKEAQEFQRWLYHEVLPSIRKTGSYSVESKQNLTTADAIADVRRAADEIQAEFIGVQRSIALLKATSLAEKIHGIPLKELKELLPPAEHDTGFLNPTQIGERLGGIKPRMVNMLLAEAGLQYKTNKNWRLTDDGKDYGEEMPYERNNHSGYQIHWNENVINLLKSKGDLS